MKNMFDVSNLEVSRFVNLSGDMLEVIKTFPDNSIDSILTDPPYGLSFMGKNWDHSVPGPEYWKECLRVLKPGGHLLSFGGTRTYHRMTCAIEDSGFEIRDCLMWLYGSGFPKSHNVSKAIDKSLGVCPIKTLDVSSVTGKRSGSVIDDGNGRPESRKKRMLQNDQPVVNYKTPPASKEAKKHEGKGTALKPAWEPIIMARKPLEGTVAANVLEHGTGALNIDDCRIGSETFTINTFDNGAKPFGNGAGHKYTSKKQTGRWPANVLLDDQAAQILDEQTPNLKSAKAIKSTGQTTPGSFGGGLTTENNQYGDSGGASRFFYSTKVSKSERNAGLPEGLVNNHPTVKPISLMAYLCKLVTPENGVILDPFAGSGSTGCGAVQEGFRYIGIDLNDDPDVPCTEIANQRIQHRLDLTKAKQADTLTHLEM